MDKRPIGIFDSGVGGLTVVREVRKALPDENIVYFGDTARVPYGSKSKETVTKFSEQIMRFLLSKDIKAVIIACNTASSNSYDELRQSFGTPLIEVVTPGVESALSTGAKKIAVIGTEATIRSAAHERAIHRLSPGTEVISKACPLFVPLAEEGWTRNTVALSTAEIYLQELIDREVEAVILGCTHYPLLLDCIRQTLGYVTIIDPAEAAAQSVRAYLINSGMQNDCGGGIEFYVSDDTQKFGRICRLVLGRSYNAEKVEIEKY